MRKNPKTKKAKKKEKRRVQPVEQLVPDSIRALEIRSPFRKQELLDIVIVFAVAFILRLFFFFLNKQNNPLFYHPIMDFLYHHEWAAEILSGNFWGDEVFFRAPLYPYFLALLYKIGGSSIAFAVFCQHLLGAVTSVFVYILSREFFSRNVSLLAGLFAALYWPFLYFEGELLIVSLILFLDVLFLYCLAAALRQRKMKLFFAAGLLLGLSSVARPSVLIFIFALPLILRYRKIRDKNKSAGRFWRKELVLVLAGTALFVFPVIVRNYVVGRDVVPISSQAGVNFYIGNNPRSDGRTAIVPGTRPDWWGGYYDTIERAEKAMGRKLKPSEVSNYYFKEGFKFIFSSPGEAVRLFFKKLYFFWAGGERSNNKYIYFFWDLAGMGKVPLPGFWLVTPLALVGGILQWRRRKLLAPLYLFIVSYMIGVIAFFVNSRFRLPVVPVLFMFAAYTVFYFIKAYRHKSFEALKVILILILCFFVIDYDLFVFGENKPGEDSISHYSLGNAYMKMDNKELALTEYERARNISQRYPRSSYSLISRNVDYNLGLLYWEKGLCSRAIEMLEGVGGSDTYSLIALDRLADCYLKKGRAADAIQAYEKIISIQPDDPRMKVNLARAYRISGDLARSENILREQLQNQYPAAAVIHFELAATLERKGDISEAIEYYQKASGDASFQVNAYVALARLYQLLGREAEAIDYLSKAQAIQPGNPEIEARLRALEGNR